MTKRKVVHLTSVHVWSDTRIFQRMCQGLSRRNWDVTLVAANVATQSVNGVHVVGVRVPSLRVLRAIVGGYRITRAALAVEADVYHIHDPELLLWKWLLRSRRKPVIYDMHEYVPGAITTRPWIPTLLRKSLSALWGLVERTTLRRTPVVLAETSYRAHYPWLTNNVIVLNLPDTEALLSISAEKKTHGVVYVGRVSTARGSIRMLEALLLLRQRGVSVALDIVGPIAESHRRELEEIIRREELKDVRLHGYMKPDEAWRIAKPALAGLAVLSPEPNYIGSFPTKMFEYMALGLPVVVSDFPLYKDVVAGNECGICVDPLNAQALADAIERLVKNPDYAEKLGMNGREAATTRYRWDQQLDALERFYSDTMRALPENAVQ
jgi:glycosyltransferase involved in cell wall biosynthesis